LKLTVSQWSEKLQWISGGRVFIYGSNDLRKFIHNLIMSGGKRNAIGKEKLLNGNEYYNGQAVPGFFYKQQSNFNEYTYLMTMNYLY
jgi:hypothetical protein